MPNAIPSNAPVADPTKSLPSCLCAWEVAAEHLPADLASRSRLLDAARREVAKRLATDPAAAALSWNAGSVGGVTARKLSGERWYPGDELRLCLAEGGTPNATGAGGTVALGVEVGGITLPEGVTGLTLPDPATAGLAGRLVGLGRIKEDVHLDWTCRWDGAMRSWAAATGGTVPAPLRDGSGAGVPLYLFAGPPGTGKSALARAVADAYCRERGIRGTLLTVTTQVRGEGLVGDLGRRVHAAFTALRRQPPSQFRCLVLEEADALAVRRGGAQMHHEDMAGTASLLQALDALAGSGEARAAVFATTNRAGALDPAFRRRCAQEHRFPRPGWRARRDLLAAWLPGASAADLAFAASCAAGMTPADVERAVRGAYRDAVRGGTRVSPVFLTRRLGAAPRTGEV